MSSRPRGLGEVIRRCLLAGMRAPEIARQLGVQRTTVHHHRQALGPPSGRRARAAEDSARDPAIRFRRCTRCGGREDVTTPHPHGAGL